MSAATPGGGAWLEGPDEDGRTRQWPIEGPSLSIGRQPPAEIVLPFPVVSRAHARVERTVSGFALVDLGGPNGTFVNGEPVRGRRELRSGDEIVIAGAASLRFFDPAETMVGQRVGRLSGLWLDRERGSVWLDARRVEPPLSAAQLALLDLLERKAGAVVDRAQAIAAVWPDEDSAGVSRQALDAVVKRLRARLRAVAPDHEYVRAVRGRGWRFVAKD